MASGMRTGVRPTIPPNVRESEERFHPAAKELAIIYEANMVERPVGSSTSTPKLVVEGKADMKGMEFDKKILSPAAFEKFEEARAAAKVIPIATDVGFRRANGDDVKVIPLGTSSALPSKYRNGMPSYFSRVKRSDDRNLHLSLWVFNPYSESRKHPSRSRRGDVGSNVPVLRHGYQQTKQCLGSFEGY